METIWKLMETCIIPIITYGAETWDLNKTQTKKLNKILDNTIRRLIRTPQSIPRESLYHELDILDIEHRIIAQRILYATKLIANNQNSMSAILKSNDQDASINKTKRIAENNDLNLETLENLHYDKRKEIVKKQIKQKTREKINTTGKRSRNTNS